MRVLVTGGAGYIGSHTAKALAAAGHLPVALDTLERGHREAVRWGTLVEADLGDRAALDTALREHRIEAVIHFAACLRRRVHGRPDRCFRNNVAGTLNPRGDARARIGTWSSPSSCAIRGHPPASPWPRTSASPVNPYGGRS
jgi:UDP-arabinose 4-epimerase